MINQSINEKRRYFVEDYMENIFYKYKRMDYRVKELNKKNFTAYDKMITFHSTFEFNISKMGRDSNLNYKKLFIRNFIRNIFIYMGKSRMITPLRDKSKNYN